MPLGSELSYKAITLYVIAGVHEKDVYAVVVVGSATHVVCEGMVIVPVD